LENLNLPEREPTSAAMGHLLLSLSLNIDL